MLSTKQLAAGPTRLASVEHPDVGNTKVYEAASADTERFSLGDRVTRQNNHTLQVGTRYVAFRRLSESEAHTFAFTVAYTSEAGDTIVTIPTLRLEVRGRPPVKVKWVSAETCQFVYVNGNNTHLYDEGVNFAVYLQRRR